MDFSAVDTTKTRLDKFIKLREKGISKSRRIVSLSRSLIQEIHNRHKHTTVEKVWQSIKESKQQLIQEFHNVKELIETDPRLRHAGFWRNAMQELTEAITFYSLLAPSSTKKKELPSPKEIGVTDKAYILGLCDLPGELQREVLSHAKKEQFTQANTLLSLIDTLYEKLMKFDYPHSVLPGLKKKQDITSRISLSTRETLLKIEKETELRKALENKRKNT